jgi:hypothetical protein
LNELILLPGVNPSSVPSTFWTNWFFFWESTPLPCPARTRPAGTLPCPARPCWPPSQPVSPSPVFAGPGPVVRLWRTRAPSQTDGRSEFIYKIVYSSNS